jgi:hypothetical protein
LKSGVLEVTVMAHVHATDASTMLGQAAAAILQKQFQLLLAVNIQFVPAEFTVVTAPNAVRVTDVQVMSTVLI